MFLSPTETVDILCHAYLIGFNWPHYIWILMDMNRFHELSQFSNLCSQNTSDSVMVSLDNAILAIRPKHSTSSRNSILPYGLNYSIYYNKYIDELKMKAAELNVTLQSNPYANVLYDSIWAFAFSLDRSLSILKRNNFSLSNISHSKSEILEILGKQLSELSFHGATGFLNFSCNNVAALQTMVELFQFQKDHFVMIGSYNFKIDLLQLNITTLSDISTDLEHVYAVHPIPLTIITLILMVLCFAMTVVFMCLYFYYRKQPSIKATSTTLSICLFVGCYILLLSLLFRSITSSLYLSEEQVMEKKMSKTYRALLCICDTYLIAIGIDIIFATIIAKTLRIYVIFNTFGKVNRICSDQCLFVLILIIVSVKVALLVLWTCLDVNHLIFAKQIISQSLPPYILVSRKCQSNYLEIWTGILFGYSSLLMLIMIFLAALTRKIKRQHFNDGTIIICKLVLLLVMNMCITLSLWFIFYYVDASTLRIP